MEAGVREGGGIAHQNQTPPRRVRSGGGGEEVTVEKILLFGIPLCGRSEPGRGPAGPPRCAPRFHPT